MTSRKSKTRSRSWGTSTVTVTGLGMYQMVHLAPVEGKDPRSRLLEAAIEAVAEGGIADLSLRRLAERVGTSHRMLIHHFGSKDGLWVAIVRGAGPPQTAAVADLNTAREASYADA